MLLHPSYTSLHHLLLQATQVAASADLVFTGPCVSEYVRFKSLLRSANANNHTVRIAGAVLSLLVPSRTVGIDAAVFALLSAGGLPLILAMILLMSIV